MIDKGKHNVIGVNVCAVDYESAVDKIIGAAKARRPLGGPTGTLGIEFVARLQAKGSSLRPEPDAGNMQKSCRRRCLHLFVWRQTRAS